MTIYRSIGSKHIDDLLGGGIPEDRAILVVGGPGTGKTTLGVQYLLEGVINDESGLHILLEENPYSLARRLDFLNWGGVKGLTYHKAVINGDISILDLLSTRIGYLEKYDISNIICPPIFQLGDILGIMYEIVKENNIKRIVIDSLQSFFLIAEREVVQLRELLLTILEPYRRAQIGILAISERMDDDKFQSYQFMDYVFDGIISLGKGISGDSSSRSLRVEKAVWAEHDNNQHLFHITSNSGIKLYTT